MDQTQNQPAPELLPWLHPAAFEPLTEAEEANLAAWLERFKRREQIESEYREGMKARTPACPF
jgi:hypothetical protein